MSSLTWFTWFHNLIITFARAGSWLITPIEIGELSISPLALMSFTGLVAFIGVAVVKWIVS